MIDKIVGTAAAALADVPDGAVVNLGIGLPTRVADHLAGDKEVLLHSENGLLGAFQVAANGDLANWHTGAADAIPAVGGAMDLAIGARETWVLMEHTTKGGQAKLVRHCSYPLTGLACVRRVYTDLAVLELRPGGVFVLEMAPGVDRETLQACTGAPLCW